MEIRLDFMLSLMAVFSGFGSWENNCNALIAF
jgi:hypothetical protein